MTKQTAVIVGLICVATTGFPQAPSPARSSTPAKKAGAAPAMKQEVHGTLIQVMRGILYPASNVIFAAQSVNPADVKPAKDAPTATDPLQSTYGQWQAVENAGIALSESANLLIIPGRKCSNGVPVPLQNPDWAKFVQGLREAGMAAYKAAQSKNQDEILNATDAVSTACSNCHDKWREKPSLAERCK